MATSLKDQSRVDLVDDPLDLVAIRTSEDEKYVNERFRRSHAKSIDEIRVQAACVARMKDKGWALPNFGGVQYLLRIAAEQLDPRLYYVAQGFDDLLERTYLLLPDDQHRVARNEEFVVAQLDEQGAMTKPRSVAVFDMTAAEWKQVFYRGRVRSETEQLRYLRDKLERERRRQLPAVQPEKWSIDHKRKVAIVPVPMALTLEDLLSAVKQLGDGPHKKR